MKRLRDVSELHPCRLGITQLELKDKQARIDNFEIFEILKNFTVNQNKKDESREQQAIKVRNKSNDYDIVRAFLEIDKFYHRFQKIKRPTAYSADTHGISFVVNQEC